MTRAFGVIWRPTPEEYPPAMCRRCDRGFYADEEADAEERENWIAPTGKPHIKRMNLTRDQHTYGRAMLALEAGKPVTYCGLVIDPIEGDAA